MAPAKPRMEAPLEGATVQSVLPATNGFAVVELELIVQGELDEGVPIVRQQYERVIANSSASQETSALMSQLRAGAEIEVFEDRIQ